MSINNTSRRAAPWAPLDCDSEIVNRVETCVLRTEFIGGNVPGAPIYNITEIINNFLNCVANPLQLDGANCAELKMGFCGSIVQFVNGAWEIYRSPGICEVTVGTVNANYASVTDALAASGNTNCRFIRITESTVEPAGNINIPPDTLVYLDPGVTWTPQGALVLSGAFILTGATNLASSIVEFGDNPFFITGAGQCILSNLRFRHSGIIPNNLLINPVITSVLTNLRVEQNAANCFVNDASAPFASLIMNDVYVEFGVAIVNPLSIQITQAASIVRAVQLSLSGAATGSIINCTNPSTVWSNLSIDMPGATTHILQGNIQGLVDSNNTTTVTVGANVVLSDCTLNTLVVTGNFTTIQNVTIDTLDLTAVLDSLTLRNVTINTNFALNAFNMGTSAVVNNLTYNGILDITTTMPNAIALSYAKLNGFTANTNWTIVLGNNTRLEGINCLVSGGDINYNISGGVAVGGTGVLRLSSLVCNNFFHGDVGVPTTGDLILLSVDLNTLVVNTSGNENISNFRIREPTLATAGLNIQGALFGQYQNGVILSSLLVTNNIRDQHLNGLDIYGNVTLNTESCSFGNFLCFSNTGGQTPATYHSVTITGNDNTFNNFNTHKPLALPGNFAGGTLTVSGNGNVLDLFNLVGSSVVMTGAGNHLQNFRVRGCLLDVDSPPGPQLFHIHGSQSKLSNIHLGASLIAVAADGTFTTDGFGSNSTGEYSIQLGSSVIAVPTRALQVSNLSLYPRRGQTAAPAQDINGILTIGGQTMTIDAPYSIVNNARMWSYPGNAAPLVLAHQTSAQTLFIVNSFSQFDSIIVGYGGETDIAVGDCGIYDCQGIDNAHKNINTFEISAAVGITNQFISCVQRGGPTLVVNAASTICVANRDMVLASIAATTGQSATIVANSNT